VPIIKTNVKGRKLSNTTTLALGEKAVAAININANMPYTTQIIIVPLNILVLFSKLISL
jgi:hypothetical protein